MTENSATPLISSSGDNAQNTQKYILQIQYTTTVPLLTPKHLAMLDSILHTSASTAYSAVAKFEE